MSDASVKENVYSKGRPWLLAEVPYAFVKEHQYEVAVLPLGACEPHNLHLPYGTDAFQSNVIAAAAGEWAWQRGGNVVVLPTLPYGTQTNQQQFPLAMNIYPQTLDLVMKDLLETLVRCGIRKVLIFNGHGGNEIKGFLRETCLKSPAEIFAFNWFRVANKVALDIFSEPEDHAGEMETSLGLAYFGDLVGKNADGTLVADEGRRSVCRFDAVQKGWVEIARPWHLLTTNSGSGNPHGASADKGRQLMERLTQIVGTFLLELSGSTMDERFPY